MNLFAFGLIVVLLLSSSYAHGQKTTEQFIPIGQSPGLSNKYTYIGVIEAVDSQEGTITTGGQVIKITEDTRIWLDRSSLKLTNQGGEFTDLREGRKIEIKYIDAAKKQVAEWVKVQVTTQ
ncbi:MAG: DUF5666 domain-containing protein [Acidiferrobacterales bacterium]|nr:DUF5666 domain-containing protein [Acidiferrobacterales bacterium]